MQNCSKDELKQLKSGITIIDEALWEVPETIEASSQQIPGPVESNLDENWWHDKKLVYFKREIWINEKVSLSRTA